MSKYSLIEPYRKVIFLIVAAMLLLSILPLPYGYYSLLRLVVTISSILGILIFNKEGDSKAVICLGFIGILFNPFIPIHLDRMVWAPIDIISAIYFYYLSRISGEKYGK